MLTHFLNSVFVLCLHLHKPPHPQITDGQVGTHTGNFLLCSHRSHLGTVQDSDHTHQYLSHTNPHNHEHTQHFHLLRIHEHCRDTAHCVFVIHTWKLFTSSVSKDSCGAHPCSSSSSSSHSHNLASNHIQNCLVCSHTFLVHTGQERSDTPQCLLPHKTHAHTSANHGNKVRRFA